MSKNGPLRASDADREVVVDRLHKAATEGRIASEELEQRVSTALKARTYDELESTLSDLPGPNARHVPARRPTSHWALSTVRSNPMLLLVVIPVVAVTAAMVLAATIVWSVLMIVVMILGGRHRALDAPWLYARRHGLRPPRRGPGSHWA